MKLLIKKLYPDCKIVVGGEHPSAAVEDVLKNSFIDMVILGEGEETFLNLLQSIDKREDYKNINGIAYKNEAGDIIKTERHIFIRLYPNLVNLNDLESCKKRITRDNEWILIDEDIY